MNSYSKADIEYSIIELKDINVKYPEKCAPIQPSNAPVVLSWSNLTVSICVSK